MSECAHAEKWMGYSSCHCALDLVCADCNRILARLTDQQRMADNNATERWARGVGLNPDMVSQALAGFMVQRSYPCVARR